MTIRRIIRAIKGLRYRRCFVMLDARGNSVTLSKGLYRHIMRTEGRYVHTCVQGRGFKAVLLRLP